MTPMATGLSDDDMADLAAYFASQKPTGLEADPASVPQGQRLYRGGDPKHGVAGVHRLPRSRRRRQSAALAIRRIARSARDLRRRAAAGVSRRQRARPIRIR